MTYQEISEHKEVIELIATSDTEEVESSNGEEKKILSDLHSVDVADETPAKPKSTLKMLYGEQIVSFLEQGIKIATDNSVSNYAFEKTDSYVEYHKKFERVKEYGLNALDSVPFNEKILTPTTFI